ncbi:MAG: calcium/sodium antiporter [Gammaproteobacteria bacterium]|nr:calcium/sodium antiporter [Gammaproteobacteria bacterium]
MILACLVLMLALAGLVITAERFVEGCAALANNFGVAPIIIGVTIIGFGTSAPEILVSGIAALQGNVGLAIGNAIGSNIANIGLILGITVMIKPITIQTTIFRCELPALLIVSLGTYWMIADKSLDRIDGVILVGFLAMFLGWLIRLCIQQNRVKNQADEPVAMEFDSGIPKSMSNAVAVVWTFAGLAGLIISSKVLVWAAVSIARTLGVSDLIIGLTIIALGTSLPELAASIASVLKNKSDMAIGNVIGSNIYNLCAVLSLPALVAPGVIDAQIVYRDYLIMGVLTLLLALMAADIFRRGQVGRLSGLILLSLYFGYQWNLYQSI